ncbi:hypothetical protein ABZR86_02690 [Dyella marensis]|uniref:Uncharacterized protein n=1 Tax=Dyella marensis TaxID=500610 RepID=A0A1I1ZW54_9GAMM|nr:MULTISPECIES: hypothetical protein [Dyella]SFE36014.1 hypothetical protein SAMN02799615_00837 [Dyella marensis]
MADAGFTVYGDSGVAQVDNTYANLSLVEKGTLTTNQSLYGASVTYGTIGPRSDLVSPIICVGGSLYARPETFYGAGQIGFNISVAGPLGTQVPYYIFDVPRAPPAHGFGLQVWNAAGQLIFDASAGPMRVVGFVQNATGTTIFAGTAGRAYAVAHVIRGFRSARVEGFNVRAVFTQVASNVVNQNLLIVQDLTSGDTPVLSANLMTALVIDVTNL